MKSELRHIKASVMAGISDILIGLIFYFIGFADWYYNHFHFFGILGLGLLLYSYWYIYFYRKEVGNLKW